MELTHLNREGNPRIVNIIEKGVTKRRAVAVGEIWMSPGTKEAILEGKTKKGGVLQTAIVAGVLGAKETSRLIPMCHPIPIEGIEVKIEPIEKGFRVSVEAETTYKTGIEMEALTGVSIALLTIYDMVKGIEKGMVLTNIHLELKEGGRSGLFKFQQRPEN
ncbi:MAG: cyclic pyranopterin monophosphate synthase MoaC [Campylobacterales bacterium]